MPIREAAVRTPVWVTMVGAGGINQRVAGDLFRYLNFHAAPGSSVEVWDGDVGTHENLDRQHVVPGVNKAEFLVGEHRDRFGNLHLRAVPRFIDDNDVAGIVARSQAIISGVDNGETRRMLVSGFRRTGQDGILITAGVDGVNPKQNRSGHRATVHCHVREGGQCLTNAYDVFHILPTGDHPSRNKKEPGCLELLAYEPQLIIANTMAAAAALLCFTLWFEGHRPVPEDVVANCLNGTMVSSRRPIVEEDTP